MASQTLDLRCASHLAAGQTNAAFEDAHCAIRIAELLREEPLLISQLVRYAQGILAVRTVWQGLADHRWNDVQLAALQDQLARIDYWPGLVLAFEGERAAGILNLEHLIGGAPNSVELMGDDRFKDLLRLIPRGILRYNQVALGRYHTRVLGTLRTATNMPYSKLLSQMQSLGETIAQDALALKSSPYSRLAALMMATPESVIRKKARALSTVKIAVVACALERYFLRHGAYPENLGHLVPGYLAALPPDPMSHEPFQYRRTADGWFDLYSVGPNGEDDNRVLRTSGITEEKDWPWPVPSRPERWRLF